MGLTEAFDIYEEKDQLEHIFTADLMGTPVAGDSIDSPEGELWIVDRRHFDKYGQIYVIAHRVQAS